MAQDQPFSKQLVVKIDFYSFWYTETLKHQKWGQGYLRVISQKERSKHALNIKP
jgi:hypothetical protein